MSEKNPTHAAADGSKRRTVIISVAAIAVAALIFVSALFFSGVLNPGSSDNGDSSVTATEDNSAFIAAFKGKWAVDIITSYEFDGAGKGVMHTSIEDYSFTYTANATELKIDFASDKASDATYTYTIAGSLLNLKAADGAEYKLNKE